MPTDTDEPAEQAHGDGLTAGLAGSRQTAPFAILALAVAAMAAAVLAIFRRQGAARAKPLGVVPSASAPLTSAARRRTSTSRVL